MPQRKLKFNNLSDPNSDDEDTQPEIVVETNVNNDGDHGESGGNIYLNVESTNTGEESSRNVGNNSGGDAEGSPGHSQQQNVFQGESSRSVPPIRSVWSRDHPFEMIIGDPDVGVRTRSATQNECLYSVILSKMEPKNIEEALTDPDRVVAMQEELNQFEHQKVWTLVPRPQNGKVIDTRWVFRNKLDEEGTCCPGVNAVVEGGLNTTVQFYRLIQQSKKNKYHFY